MEYRLPFTIADFLSNDVEIAVFLRLRKAVFIFYMPCKFGGLSIPTSARPMTSVVVMGGRAHAGLASGGEMVHPLSSLKQ